METEYHIPFTQYLLPDGRKRDVTIVRPKEIYDKAMDIVKAGHRFEAEVLTTGMVSLTIFNLQKQEDVAIKVVSNGPEVQEAIDRMITRFHEEALSNVS
jgi:hypothetical protein